MPNTVIKVENLSKQYRIGAHEGYKTFRETLVDAAKAPFRAFKKLNPEAAIRNPQSETIWALRDVSFEVKQGEVVGIIGRNGAGKSTLLKILSQITEPTEGRVELRGRVGSLLEVGTGFHPELTGHENVYLYGAILGMDRCEVTRKFDEIVAFAEIEKFIDTPVKRYSSGMYMRLAFAVAAHMETEILLVDEVLAVGDASFQKKCLGKMGDVSKESRTVFFVSHNMDAILRLCGSTIYLESGEVMFQGPTASVIDHYISNSFNTESGSVVRFDIKNAYKKLFFTQVCLTSSQGEKECVKSVLECHINYNVMEDTVGAVIAIRIDSMSGSPVMTLTDNDLDEKRFMKRKGAYKTRCILPSNLLAPGTYRITISAADMKGTRFDYHEGILSFDVSQSPKIKPSFRREGSLLVPISWQIQES